MCNTVSIRLHLVKPPNNIDNPGGTTNNISSDGLARINTNHQLVRALRSQQQLILLLTHKQHNNTN